MNVTFAPGDDLREQLCLQVATVNDSCVEETEVFTMQLTSFDEEIEISSNNETCVTILDDDCTLTKLLPSSLSIASTSLQLLK